MDSVALLANENGPTPTDINGVLATAGPERFLRPQASDKPVWREASWLYSSYQWAIFDIKRSWIQLITDWRKFKHNCAIRGFISWWLGALRSQQRWQRDRGKTVNLVKHYVLETTNWETSSNQLFAKQPFALQLCIFLSFPSFYCVYQFM